MRAGGEEGMFGQEVFSSTPISWWAFFLPDFPSAVLLAM